MPHKKHIQLIVSQTKRSLVLASQTHQGHCEDDKSKDQNSIRYMTYTKSDHPSLPKSTVAGITCQPVMILMLSFVALPRNVALGSTELASSLPWQWTVYGLIEDLGVYCEYADFRPRLYWWVDWQLSEVSYGTTMLAFDTTSR